jgi:hypothetical protein
MDTAETPATPKRRNHRKLETIADVRRCLARALRALEKGDMPPDKAKALIYGYKTLAELIRGSDFEERLARLEGSRALEAVQ